METVAEDLGDPPRDFVGLRSLLMERHQTLPKRLAQVARFAVAHPDEMAFGTAASIAEQASVQPSTLVRFAQTIGYQGFSDLQEIFRARLRDRWPDYEERLESLSHQDRDREGLPGLLDGFAQAGVTSLMRLRDSIDAAQLDKAAALLAAADTIYLLGQRRAFPITAYMAYALGKLGVKSILIDNVGTLGQEQSAFAGKKDALISISFTPYAPATIELTKATAARGVPLVAITDSPFSPLTELADAWFEVVEADFAAFRSLSACFCLAMALSVSIAEKRRGG
ncbi:MurR/RpiR family transcriptional regulator [Pelagibius litoralis]|uniref:MurR/RpiR family transcriptional regulator n=1 Tax=Pelagibius litoralis TaxID=374515 RepID=A0A967C4X9_9PROT|nr:MurR/RpiR family transcriptional regulator [Pelagibius litoralis]NIA67421.1 MurR/RpiR family transcriptional regulator [Pelagibius litoralis]